MEAYSMTREELEDVADAIKAAVIRELTREGVLAQDEADEWAQDHTVIVRKKRIFRTITKLWTNAEEAGGILFIVVSRLPDGEES